MSIASEAIWAASPSTARGSPTPLSSDSKGERLAYASNKSIFVRSIDHPAISKQYTAHTSPTTVARFSPSGFYIASGDISGSVRVWDSIEAEKTKGEYHIIAGRINDIAWDGDSQRIIAVGNGKERFGHCITADSGNSVGEISGHSLQINCVSIRQQRPLRAATGSDDTSVGFFHGAPFKFNTSVRGTHNKFVYGTQFSPDGSALVSVGSDRRIWLYDGKTGEQTAQIGEGQHEGSIFGVSWAQDSRKLVTCSADQTVKIWDAERDKCTQSWRIGTEGEVSIPDQQVGITWAHGRSDGLIISVDLEGNLNYFNEGSPKPSRVVRGHQKAITALTYLPSSCTLWTGSYDGRARCWDVPTGAAESISGEEHTNYVSGIAASEPQARIYSVGWDDRLRTIDAAQKNFVGLATKTDGQPGGIAIAHVDGKEHTLVSTASGITAYVDGEQTSVKALPSPPTYLAASGELLAVGSEHHRVLLFSAAGFKSMGQVDSPAAAPSYLAFSPSGGHLAVGLANGKIYVYARPSSSAEGGVGEWKLETSRWSAHTGRVTALAWSPDGKKVVSGSLDTHVFVWSLAEPGLRVKAGNAHQGGVGGVVWVGKARVVSVGADAAVKVWKVEGVP